MIWLLLGLALWSAAHMFKRLAPDMRARMGDKAKGPVALTLLVGLVLIVIGYCGWDSPQIWTPAASMVHLNNLLLLLAVYLFAASGMKTRITRVVRHPQLAGVSLWAIGHLLANGDLASVVLFGWLLVWALVEMRLIGHTAAEAAPPASPGREIGAAVGAVLVLAVLGYIHTLFGLNPFGG